ncbi:polyprenol phosphomannose-dependent alpha 1,6 mannosyltransferase MptB [Rugosimonospora acidiphila]|uniref:polyprenol phosphomannose-dependent alpha 1,6 mannosyltransferase MptB n=1 Tax=Rugosimonospora acidiphila TaxID=556531 RepID=UPI0031E4F128
MSRASAKSARPGPWRQAAGRAKVAVTGATGLGAVGLVGAGGLAAASYLANGAHPRGAAPVAVWLVGTVLLAGAWLGLGRRLDRVPPGRLLLIGLLWAAVLLASAPLGSRDGYAYACQGTLVTHGVDPYTSGIAALPCPWLTSVPALWWTTPTPYGPLWLMLSGAAAAGSGGHLAVAIALLRVIAVAGVALIGWAGLRLARTLGVDPARAAWLGALSPVVLVHAVSGVHNDALLAGLVVTGLAVAARPAVARPAAPRPPALAAAASGPAASGPAVPGPAASGPTAPETASLASDPPGIDPLGIDSLGTGPPGIAAWWASPLARAALAGALIGLAVGVKATALVALPFVALLAAGDRRWWQIIRAGAVACLGLAAGYAVFAVPSGYGVGWLPALRGTAQLIQWTSLPTGIGMAAGYLVRGLGRPDLATPALDVARAVGLVILTVTLVGLWLRARRLAERPQPVVAAAGVALAATVLLAPVAFPWYLLAPLAVLAFSVSGERARHRLALGVAGLALLVLPDGTGVAALTKLPGALLDTALVITILVVLIRRRRAGRATPTATGC